jgi:predicted nuclease of predicted toxin-antitoxin system
MRFLAEESCDYRVVRALRAAGHDVKAVIELAPGAADSAIFEMAEREERIFVTEDRDFGQLVYAGPTAAAGVILLRYPSTARARLPAIVVDVVTEYAERIPGRFVVLEPGRIRFGGRGSKRSAWAGPIGGTSG